MRYAAFVLMFLAGTVALGQDAPKDPWSLFTQAPPNSPQEATLWAKPLASGPIRVLCIAPRYTLRDAYALAERIDVRLDCVPLWDATRLGCDGLAPEGAFPDATNEETAKRLSKVLDRSYDVIWAGNFDFSVLPQDILNRLIEMIKGGTGLVLAYHKEGIPVALSALLSELTPADTTAALTHGVGEAATPEWPKGLYFLDCGKAGKGRVVQLNYGGDRPATHFLLPPLAQPAQAEWAHYETYLGMLARVTLWAAAREPEARIASIEAVAPTGPSDSEIPPELFPEFVQRSREVYLRMPGRQFVVHLDKPADRNYGVKVQLRTPGAGWLTTYQAKAVFPKGQDSYLLNLSIGPGQRLLDVWLLDRDKVVTWYSEPIQVHGWPEIANLTFTKNALMPNDTIGVGLTIAEAAYARQPSTVYVRGIDPYGRLVGETMIEVPEEGGAVTARLDFADLLGPRVRLEIFALPKAPSAFGGRPYDWDLQLASFAYVYLPVRQTPQQDTFSFVAQGLSCDEFNQRSALRTLADTGVNLIETPATDAASLWPLETGLRPLPRLTQYANYRVADGGVRVPSLNDPTFRESEAQVIKDRALPFRVVTPGLYTLGDGNCVSAAEEDLCHSSVSLEGFRAYLTGVYGDLAALNAAWKTSYTSWDEVMPASREVATAGAYATWLDFRRYMDMVLTGTHTFGRDLILGLDREAHVGFIPRAGNSPYRGYDRWQLTSQMGVMTAPPESVEAARLRCYAPHEAFDGILGSAAPDDLARGAWLPWYAAVNGLRCFWWDTPLGGSTTATLGPALGQGGGPTAAFFAAATAVDALESGIGTVLLRAKRQPATIALYDSQASRYLDALNNPFGGHDAALAAYAALLGDLCIAYDVVSYEQAVTGGLVPYKAVLLPQVRALSDAEVEALRAFHASGGAVLADIAPAQFDDHGTQRAIPALADVFGVRYTTAPTPSEAGDAQVTLGGDAPKSETIPGIVADKAVEAAGTTALGKIGDLPVWFAHNDEKTHALLTDIAISTYGSDDSKERDAALRDLWSAALGQLLPTPAIPFDVRTERGFHGDTAVYTYDKATVVVAVRRPEGRKTEKLRVRFGDKARVYDMLAATPLVQRGSVSRTLGQGQATALAALPYEVTQLIMAAPEGVGQGKRINLAFEVKTRNGEPGEHCVQVTLSRLYGGPLRHYSRTVICAGGKGQTYIPLAHNELVGVYRLRARDVLSGTTAETMLQVLPTGMN